MESARRRVRIARYGITVVAAGALAAGAVVVRAAHPGKHSGQTTLAAQAAVPGESSTFQQAAGQSSSSVSPAPAGGAPVVQSSGS
ncbi:MAG TPA: hypothetical protein VMU73_05305 [Gaiellaceae bacterium]|nr:hypothetical protein [Gaiellaceae bacterium]